MNELLSWVIETWMRNHFVSERTCNYYRFMNLKKGVINNVRFIVGVGDTTRGGVQLVLSRMNRIGHTKYYIYCSRLEIWTSTLIS